MHIARPYLLKLLTKKASGLGRAFNDHFAIPGIFWLRETPLACSVDAAGVFSLERSGCSIWNGQGVYFERNMHFNDKGLFPEDKIKLLVYFVLLKQSEEQRATAGFCQTV